MIDLTKIRAMLDTATPGPWEVVPQSGSGDMIALMHDPHNRTYICAMEETIIDGFEPEENPDTTFIAESRTLIPKLLNEIEWHENSYKIAMHRVRELELQLMLEKEK